jgi:transporter family protein
MKNLLLSWVFWALLSAGFAALTAIFAKVGIENVNSDFATFIRTVVILLVAGMIVYTSGNWQGPSSVSAKTWLFLILSGAATGASWICYFRALKLGDAARVAPVDKLSVVFVSVFAVLLGRAACAAKLAWRDSDRLRCRSRCLPSIGETCAPDQHERLPMTAVKLWILSSSAFWIRAFADHVASRRPVPKGR